MFHFKLKYHIKVRIRLINKPLSILHKVWTGNIFRYIFLFSIVMSCSGSAQNEDHNKKNKAKIDNVQIELKEKKRAKELNFDENGVIHINVSQKFPTLHLAIQDIAEIDYINLNNNNALIEGTISVLTKDKIIGYNFKSGDIFILNKNGQLINKFNHIGRGSGEYSRINGLTFDDKAGELFINDMQQGKVHVFDINGKHKRSLPFIEGRFYHEIMFFNEGLVCCDQRPEHPITFFLVSKMNGSKIKDFQISYNKKIASTLHLRIGPGTMAGATFKYKAALPYRDQIILNEVSSDTIFMTDGHILKPVASHSPSMPAQDPPGYLLLTLQTSDFTFFRSVINEYNFDTNIGFPSKEIVFDRVNGKTYFAKLYNEDYETESEFEIESPIIPGVSVKRLNAIELVEANRNGKLKGELMEIASTLDADDNPVLMFMRYKE